MKAKIKRKSEKKTNKKSAEWLKKAGFLGTDDLQTIDCYNDVTLDDLENIDFNNDTLKKTSTNS